MTNIIVAFSKAENAENIKNILMKHGFQVVAVCTSGAQALSSLDGLNGGIVVSGYRFADMLYQELADCMPAGFQMLLVASAAKVGDSPPESMVYLPMPLKVHELVGALKAMCELRVQERKKRGHKPVKRSEAEKRLIQEAKDLLMESSHMTEGEAHRYIQKCSMDSGTNMVETAQMVVSLIKNQKEGLK